MNLLAGPQEARQSLTGDHNMPFNPLSEELKKYLLGLGEQNPSAAQFFPEARTTEEISETGLAEMPSALESAQRPLRNLTAEDEPIPFTQRVPAYVSPDVNAETDRPLTEAEQRLNVPDAPELTEPVDLPLEQAKAALSTPQPAISQTEHVDEALKADDSAKKQEEISQRITDPIEYMRRKMGMDIPSNEEFRAAQREADIGRTLSGLGKTLSEAAYGWRGLDLPEAQRKSFEESVKAAELPVERLKQRREAAEQRSKLFDNALDTMTKDLDTQRKQRLFDPNSPESRAVSKLIGEILPPELQDLKNDPDFQALSAMDKKEFVSTLLQQRATLEERKASREALQDYRQQQLELAKQKLATAREKASEKLQKPSKGTEETDRKFATSYANWIAEKGSLSADKSLANLEASIQEMEKPENKKLTGGFMGAVLAVAPESLKSAINAKIGRIDSNLRSAVVDTLRPLLGAQFAAVEGERIMKQTFDPNQPMEENIRRAKLVLNDLKNQVASKKRAVQYWESHDNTLEGYEAFPHATTETEPSFKQPTQQQIDKFVEMHKVSPEQAKDILIKRLNK